MAQRLSLTMSLLLESAVRDNFLKTFLFLTEFSQCTFGAAFKIAFFYLKSSKNDKLLFLSFLLCIFFPFFGVRIFLLSAWLPYFIFLGGIPLHINLKESDFWTFLKVHDFMIFSLFCEPCFRYF